MPKALLPEPTDSMIS